MTQENHIKIMEKLTQEDEVLVAFSLDGTLIRRGEFRRAIGALQLRLRQTLGDKQKHLALCCDNAYSFAVALYASIGLDQHIVMLPNSLSETLEAHSNVFDAVISDQPLTFRKHPVIATNSTSLTEQEHNVELDLSLSKSQIHMFTSGSTSEPKKITKSFHQLLDEVLTLRTLFKDQLEGCHFIATVSHQHIYGTLFQVLLPIQSLQPFCCDQIEFQEQLSALPEERYALISSPAFLKCLQHNDGTTSRLSCTFSSGGPLLLGDSQRASAILGSAIYEILGSTETGGIAWRQQLADDSAWRPLPQVKIDMSEDSTLVVSSPYAGGTQHIQDQIEILDDGSFLHKGRADRVVKIGEKRLNLLELEAHAQSSPLVAEAAALTVIKRGRERVALVVALTQNGNNLLAENGKHHCNEAIRLYLQQRFDRVLLPRYFRYCTHLPINKQGKRVERQLQALFIEENT
ncbi:acyl-CoA synthetase [Corallincola luteus]|uniref:Acyl-CoA synthetase n=1 Tax=Corallincola luteus TaxID=1775177 RepID=A0ABY2AKC2_9GAMM|nr:AMP-binding protein [Corallincola luteus]TCI03285.1 acyl-CoA synthetase [Corallincola luteus]